MAQSVVPVIGFGARESWLTVFGGRSRPDLFSKSKLLTLAARKRKGIIIERTLHIDS